MPRLSQILRGPCLELCRMDQDDRFRIAIPRWSCPTFSIGHPSHRRHSRHCLSGIYLGFVSDGSPLPTGGDEGERGSYRIHGSALFHLGPSIFASQGPTPAARPSGWTRSCASEPCLSPASWLALPCLASISLNEAGRGVNGFGSFCRNKKPVLSPAEGDLGCRAETHRC